MSAAIPVIINAGAGNPHVSERAQELEKLFLNGGITVDVRLASTGEQLDALIRAAVAEHPPMIIAAGGDGTISTAAGAIAGSDIVLGILPFGTLNHFAKDLHIPLDVEGAVRNIVDGHVSAIDVAEVNDRIFINNSSLGLYPDMVRDRERQQTRLGRGKWGSLVWASIAAFRRYPFLTVRMNVDGETRTYVSPIVFIGNNEYKMEGFEIGARARIDSGVLSAYIVKKHRRVSLLRLALQALFKRLEQARDFDALVARELEIETRHARILVSADGEVHRMRTPLRYRARPQALRVLVPRSMEEESGK